ncbi:accessory regulator AgrB [Clostridium botulinum]|uniref:accessory gene regulator B family protein n=1 Tax=Clostridium sp. ZBS18 TaxID=2949967 RepID=UPI001D6E197C|nr:accessory gene regulator B family protein [Clostridium sp. ZBS18]MBN1044403.1 accessory regulator AgrB [Clostridium botulinum]MBN1054362.1 accessory regulator AgrB [Clostridium botulinum]
MIKSFIGNFVQDICNHNGYSEEQCEQIQYTTTVLFFEFIKLMSIIIIFSLIGYCKESIIIIGIMSITKPFIGGYHENTQIKCFIATMLITTGVILLSLNCKLNNISNCILILISLFSIYNTAPVLNNKMPITRLELIKGNRILGISISSVIGISSILLYKFNNIYELITWTILFQSMFMFNKREKD